jgi:hypothetical protein
MNDDPIQAAKGKPMHTIPGASAAGHYLMAPAGKMQGSGNSGNGGDSESGSEPSLADGTGEGNAPIAGSSASSDPKVLAGTKGDTTAASLNDDDYPENIADAAGAVDEGKDSGSQPNAASSNGFTSGQHAVPDQAAGVDLKDGTAIPDAVGKK